MRFFFLLFLFFSLDFFSTTHVSHYLHLPFFSFSSSFRMTCLVASRTVSPLLPLCFFPFLLHTHTHKFLSLYLTQTNSLSYTHRSSAEKWRLAFYMFFFFILVWLVLFYCLDFIRLMRKIVFVFQIFRLGFVFLFWLWYVLVCNRWDREARESEERKRKGMREKEYFFIQPGIILRENIV